MNYWWVNQNRTFRHEMDGGYMWSPKKNRNGARNQFYENMKEVAPGDIVFSFNDTVIAHIGVITSYSFGEERPAEFGDAGTQWEKEGWKVRVEYHSLPKPLKPSNHMDLLAPTLPKKYSPIRENGTGNQVYLAKIPPEMATILTQLIGPEARAIVDGVTASTALHNTQKTLADVEAEEAAKEREEERIRNDSSITDTERKALIKSRRGQGQFRENVANIEQSCRVTGVTNSQHLIASHIKPWRVSNNQERLDGENGLLLAPHIDHLFDRGFISFADDGTLLISPIADRDALRQMGVPIDGPVNTGAFTPGQKRYLKHHRIEIFKKANADP